MARKVLYQYDRADGAVVLRATSFFDNDTAQALAGVVPYSPSGDTGTIGIFGGKSGWKSISIGVELSIDPDLLATLLPNAAKARAVTSAIVSVTSPATKYRRGEILKWQCDGKWSGKVELRRDDVEREILLSPAIVRTKSETEVEGLGCFEGAILATGEDVVLAIKEPTPPLSGDLDYKWVDFRESELSWLKQRSDDVFFMSPEARPVLYLNIRWPGLQRVLEHKAIVGVNAALRRSFRSAIGQAGWLQLLITAVGSIRETSEGEFEVVGMPWSGPLARWTASRLYPDLAAAEQLKAIHRAFRDPSEIGMVVAKIQSLVHDRTRAGRDLDLAAKAMDKDEAPSTEEEPT